MERVETGKDLRVDRATWRVRLARTCARVDGVEVRLTHPDKVLWPEEGLSKRDLAAYYLAVAPYALPYVADRPLTLEVFPQGLGGRAVYIKQRPRGAPAWLREACLRATKGHEVCYVVAGEDATGAATLAWLANRSSIPVHAWLSRVWSPRQPDWLVFDLDPGEGATFAQVVRLAQWLRCHLEDQGLRSWVKVSGSRGLHVLVPIAPERDYARTRAYADRVAAEAVRALPGDATLAWPLAERRGRVFVDVRRNGYGATIVAPYSVRALPGAPVSVPLDWRELDDPDLSPRRWNVHSTLERLREIGDPLAEALRSSQHLPEPPRARRAS